MFFRSDLKIFARKRLAQNRWNAALCVLIATVCGAFSGSVGNVSISFNTSDTSDATPALLARFLSPEVLHLIIIFAGIFIALVLVYHVFVANVINAGLCNWFLRFCRGETPEITVLFSGFKNYKHTLTTMLLRDVITFLYLLLLIIPGIVKSYSYALVPYILHDNPSLTAKQALRVSRTMTDGWKAEMFVFDLSFMGWNMLAALTCGILGIVFVSPYYLTSHALMYEAIKYDAVHKRGVIDPALLNTTQTV